MKSKLVLSATLVAALAGSALGQSDACSGASVLVPGTTYNGSTAAATNDGGSNCGNTAGSKDVWYQISVPQRRQVTIDTCTNVRFDTVLSVHRACPGTTANTVVCNDDNCSTGSRVAFTAEPGVTYYVRVGGYNGASGAFTLNVALSEPPPPPTNGPDVYVGDLQDIAWYATIGEYSSYAVGTTSCNAGDAPVQWTASDNQHPVIAQNIFRLANGRLDHIGQSWVKHGFSSVNGTFCGPCTQPPGGSTQLGIGCSDPYGSGLNGSQGGLGPRSQINPLTGAYPYPYSAPAVTDGLSRRLLVKTSDIAPASNPGAVFYAESQYIAADDATWNNGTNNASFRRINVSSTSSVSMTAATQQRRSALYAWRDADPTVTISNVDYIEGGITVRLEVGSKVTNNGNGTWTYTYAIRNMNSNRGASSLILPKRYGVAVSNASFNKPPAHPDEPYADNNWIYSTNGNSFGWSYDSAVPQGKSPNVIRWGTMYTYSYTANTAPVAGNASIALLEAGSPSSLTVSLPVPAGLPCPADFDGNGFVDGFDYDAYVMCFEGGACPPGKTADVSGDQFVDGFDYDAFVETFELGCN